MTEIWIADWVFYYKQTAKQKYDKIPVKKYVLKDVVCKRIPLRFLLNEGKDKQVKRNIPDKTLSQLENNFNII